MTFKILKKEMLSFYKSYTQAKQKLEILFNSLNFYKFKILILCKNKVLFISAVLQSKVDKRLLCIKVWFYTNIKIKLL